VKSPLTRLDWIEAAHAALVEDGIEGVRIDRLCRVLGVTKGSFYHHFDGREALLAAVADDWARERPRAVMDAARDLAADPFERLVHFIELTDALDLGRHHQAMRTWGAVDPRAAAAVREVDRVVLLFVEQALCEVGVPKQDAGALARVLLATAVGLQSLGDVVPAAEHAGLAHWLVRLVRERSEHAAAGR
jgi:AcrR family transcriptional regulator